MFLQNLQQLQGAAALRFSGAIRSKSNQRDDADYDDDDDDDDDDDSR